MREKKREREGEREREREREREGLMETKEGKNVENDWGVPYMALHFPLQIPTSVSVPSGLCFFHPLVSSYELPQSLLIFLALNASFCRPFIVDHIRVFPSFV